MKDLGSLGVEGGCPFSGAKSYNCQYSTTEKNTQRLRDERMKKIEELYLKYIGLGPLQKTWTNSITTNPRLEPLFTAGMQVCLCNVFYFFISN